MRTVPFLSGAIAVLLAIGGCSTSSEKSLAVGSKDFTEQVILGELIAQQIEAKTDIKVKRQLNLGGTFICHKAIVSGELDLYPEYTGTAFTAILKNSPINDPKTVYARVRQAYQEQFQLTWTAPLGFNNTFAILIRGEEARQKHIKTISDAAKYAPSWKAGFGYEFSERADGLVGLAKTYQLRFAEPPKSMDLGLTYRALADKQVDFIAGDATAGLIASLDLAALEDDKHYFPPYEAAIVVRPATLTKYPELAPVLRSLEGQITETAMRKMNYEVDGKKRPVAEVAREFLQTRLGK